MLEEDLIDRFLQSEPPPKDVLAWTRAPKWLAIKGITTNEIRTLSGQVERGAPLSGRAASTKITPKSKIITFGRHRGKELDWIKENDKGYYEWASTNIPNFLK